MCQLLVPKNLERLHSCMIHRCIIWLEIFGDTHKRIEKNLQSYYFKQYRGAKYLWFGLLLSLRIAYIC